MKEKRNFRKFTMQLSLLIMTIIIVFSMPISISASSNIINWADIYERDFCIQGMCIDNKNNIYYAKLHKNQIYVEICKVAPNKSQSVVYHANNTLGHANDMTYCSADGYIYVVTGGGSNKPSYDIIAFDPSKNFKIVGKYKVPEIKNLGGIAYDSKYKVFYIRQEKKIYVGNFKNGNFNSFCNFTLDFGKNDGYTRQGISTHDGHIFVPLWDKSGQRNSVIRIYDVIKKSNTSYIGIFKSVTRYDDDNNKTNTFEIEGVDFSKSGDMFFAINADYSATIFKKQAEYSLITDTSYNLLS